MELVLPLVDLEFKNVQDLALTHLLSLVEKIALEKRLNHEVATEHNVQVSLHKLIRSQSNCLLFDIRSSKNNFKDDYFDSQFL